MYKTSSHILHLISYILIHQIPKPRFIRSGVFGLYFVYSNAYKLRSYLVKVCVSVGRFLTRYSEFQSALVKPWL